MPKLAANRVNGQGVPAGGLPVTGPIFPTVKIPLFCQASLGVSTFVTASARVGPRNTEKTLPLPGGE